MIIVGITRSVNITGVRRYYLKRYQLGSDGTFQVLFACFSSVFLVYTEGLGYVEVSRG